AMGASMYALSWLGMRNVPPNPQTKMMSVLMPVMMTVLLINFASGLNLYYTVQNLAALPQQWLISRERAKAAVTTTVASGGGSARKRAAARRHDRRAGRAARTGGVGNRADDGALGGRDRPPHRRADGPGAAPRDPRWPA